mmetsp:Transcript_7670/g.11917  ORF Transcript_7670/g.11917 Transcript_7670/m.11917 type:complete len:102 (-) Transcript_7670:1884-2189(-)
MFPRRRKGLLTPACQWEQVDTFINAALDLSTQCLVLTASNWEASMNPGLVLSSCSDEEHNTTGPAEPARGLRLLIEFVDPLNLLPISARFRNFPMQLPVAR